MVPLRNFPGSCGCIPLPDVRRRRRLLVHEVTFTVTDGYQTINKINATVIITEHSDTVDYDGLLHTVHGYDVEISTPLYTTADFTFNGDSTVSGTNAGTYPMSLNSTDFTNTNNNFAEVTFNIVDGQLVIDKINATVTITGHHTASVYDATEHSVSGYDVVIVNPLYTVSDFTFTPADTAVLIGGVISAKRTFPTYHPSPDSCFVGLCS